MSLEAIRTHPHDVGVGCEKQGLQKTILEIISKFDDLTPEANAYIGAIGDAAISGEDAIRVQALYIASNLHPKTDEQKLAIQQLRAIGTREEIPITLEEKPNDVMDELELEEICSSFQSFSERKVARLEEVKEEKRCELEEQFDAGTISNIEFEKQENRIEETYRLHLDTFNRFAERYGYPRNKVLVAQDWVDEVLGEDVRNAVIIAKQEVTVNW